QSVPLLLDIFINMRDGSYTYVEAKRPVKEDDPTFEDDRHHALLLNFIEATTRVLGRPFNGMLASFDAGFMARLQSELERRHLQSAYTTGLIVQETCPLALRTKLIEWCKPKVVSIEYSEGLRDFTAEQHAAGRQVFTWTVNEEAKIRHAV